MVFEPVGSEEEALEKARRDFEQGVSEKVSTEPHGAAVHPHA